MNMAPVATNHRVSAAAIQVGSVTLASFLVKLDGGARTVTEDVQMVKIVTDLQKETTFSNHSVEIGPKYQYFISVFARATNQLTLSIDAPTAWSDRNVNSSANRTSTDSLVSIIATAELRERRVLVMLQQEYADANLVGKECIVRRLATQGFGAIIV